MILSSKYMFYVLLALTNAAKAAECDILSELVDRPGMLRFYNCRVDIELNTKSSGEIGGSIYAKDLNTGAELAVPFRAQKCKFRHGTAQFSVVRSRSGFSWSISESVVIWQDFKEKLLRVRLQAKGILDGREFERITDCRGVSPEMRLDRDR